MAQYPAGIPRVPVRTPFYDQVGGVTREWQVFLEQLPGGPRVIVDTHAKRAKFEATKYPGVWYYESDRSVYYFSIGTSWVYAFGEMAGTIDPDTADEKPGDLGPVDEGFIFRSTDFDRRYRWSGSAWERAPLEERRGQFAFFDEDPGVGWVLCDGTADRKRTTSAGGVELFTPPNLTDTYLKGTAVYTGTVNPATAPGLSGTTGAAGAHDHDVDIDHDHPTTTTTVPNVGGTVLIPQGAGANIGAASTGHSHNVDVPALGPTNKTTTSEIDHAHDKGTLTVDATAEPPNMGALIYYRA